MVAQAVGSAQGAAPTAAHGNAVHEARSKDGMLATAVGETKTDGKQRAKQRIIQSELRNQIQEQNPVLQAERLTNHITSLTLNQQVEILNKMGFDPFTKEGAQQLLNYVNGFFTENGLGAQRPTMGVGESAPESTPGRGRDVFFAIALVQFMLAAVKGNQSEMLAGVSSVKLADLGLQSDENQLSKDESSISSKITSMEHQLDKHVPWYKKILIPLAIGIGCMLLGPALGALAEGIAMGIDAALECAGGFIDAGIDSGVEMADLGAEGGDFVDAGASGAGEGTSGLGDLADAVDADPGASPEPTTESGGGTNETDADAAQRNNAEETNKDDNRIRRTKNGDRAENERGRQFRKNKEGNWEKETDNRMRWREWKENRLSSIKGEGENGLLGRYLPGKGSVMFGGMVGMATNTPVQEALAGNPQGQIAIDQGEVQLAGTDSQRIELKSKQNSNKVSTAQQEQIQSAMQANQTLGSEISQALQAISVIGSIGQG
ncbi:MAG: hypothetical protein SP1CHLAM54_17660 [Chlamydiia bacterium]|nr:hypothetical protein [Chlamydiia bacterium]MCH9616654.1 hypothetical protein [Chlamydiia bacterium]MCH9629384.1 hypothetical protein [Chlamydiia bacterium]